MEFTAVAGVIASVIGAYCTLPYIISIVKGQTKPHQFSWLVFTIMNGIILFSQYFEGAKETVWLNVIFFLGSLVIWLLSLKFGERDTSRWDRILLALALLTIVIWVLTKSNTTAIWLTLVIDILATSMMLLKIKVEPYSEDPNPWLLASVAYVFSCLTLISVPFGILYLRPTYGLLSDLTLVGFIYFMRRKSPSRPSKTMI